MATTNKDSGEPGLPRSRRKLEIFVTLTSFCAGCAIAWTSPMMNRLQGNSQSFSPLDHPLNDEEASWVSSLLTVGAIFGPIISGMLMDNFGRKKTFIILGGVPFIVGWIIILAAKGPDALYAGRIMCGISTGSSLTLGPAYIAEIASPSERGMLCSLAQLMITFGIMSQYTVGPFVSYYTLSGLNLAFPVLFIMIFIFLPESPYFLLAVKRRNAAEKSLLWFRRGQCTTSVIQELDRMSDAIAESGIHEGDLWDSFKSLLGSNGNRYALLATCIIMFTQQFCGINAVLFNAESIFQGSGKEKAFLEPSESAMVIGAVQIISSLSSTLLVDRAGRRSLLILSSGLTSLFLVALGTHSFLVAAEHPSAYSLRWLPIVSLVLYIMSYCVGLGPLPWVVLSEMFSSNVKSAAGMITGSFCWTLGFVVTRSFQPLCEASGSYGAYWLYAACSLFGSAGIAIYLPETKCKTLEEIQTELRKS